MSVDEYINQTNGVHVDEDGYYGAQCWDVVAQYARIVVGCPSFPTGSGGAEGLYRLYLDPIPQFFDKIANNTNDPNQLPLKGDVIVWEASFSPPSGHTALVISATPSGITVLEQNGNNPGGVAYIKTRNWSGISGWLRPKKGTDMRTQIPPEIVSQHYANYTNGLVQVAPTDAAAQNRFEDTLDDEFWSGLVPQLHNLLTTQMAAVADLTAQLAKLQSQFDELVAVAKMKDQRIADLQKLVPGPTSVEQPAVTPDKRSLWQVIGDFLSQFKKG